MKSDQPNGRLISWKEIAHYLQCEERTAQRWEHERGLPVQRVPGDKRGTVYAFVSEIDAWLRQQASEVQNADGQVSGIALSPQVRFGEASDPVTPDVISNRAIKFGRRAAVLIGVGLVTTAVFWLGIMSQRQFAHEVKDPVPAKYTYAEKDLIIQNRSGETLWTYRFESSLRIEDEGIETWRRIQFEDVDSDGGIEVIAAIGHRDDFKIGADYPYDLYCFGSDGKVRWKYRFAEPLTFGEKTYNPPFVVRSILVAGDKRKHVWVAYVQNTWWPTVLVKLDSQGQEVDRFVNAGYVYSLTYVRNSQGSFILAGGVNNEYDAGMLAVIDAENPRGASPQTSGSRFECKGCPSGHPARYFVFGRSELNRATASPYNAVYQIRLLSDRLDAITAETRANPNQRSESHYEFDMNFRLIGARRGDAYWNVHRANESRSGVRHPADKCPEQANLGIREWRDGNWREVRPIDILSTRKQ